MSEVKLSGYSDDCGAIEGIDVDLGEYDNWGHWHHLIMDGVWVADIMLDFEDGWTTTIRAFPGSTVSIEVTPETIAATTPCEECDEVPEYCTCG